MSSGCPTSQREKAPGCLAPAAAHIPAGQFEMGYSDAQVEGILRMSSAGQREWYRAEQPAHTVALDAFWIDKTEVTNAQFCISTSPEVDG